MVAQARKHAPNETGGILIGRSSGDVIDVLAASDAGLAAISRPTRFERDGAYCQRFLEEVAAKMGPGVDYVGEWHSHPGSSASPSVRDTTSFEEIAVDADYLTSTPLLIIVAPKSDNQVDWSFTVFPAGGLARTVEHEDVSSDEAPLPPSAPSNTVG
jgi:integrative and conjugative element protein (TIGR02256 family)